MDSLSILTVVGGLVAFVAWRYREHVKKADPVVLAIVVAVVGFVIYRNAEKFGFVEPASKESQATVSTVQAVADKISGNDSEDLGAYCLALAEAIESDVKGEVFRTVDDVRAVHSLAGQAALKSRLKKADGTSKYPGLAEAVDAALFSATGKYDTYISPDQRARLVKLLRELHAALS